MLCCRERGEAATALRAARQRASSETVADNSPGLVARGIDSIVAALQAIHSSRASEMAGSAGDRLPCVDLHKLCTHAMLAVCQMSQQLCSRGMRDDAAVSCLSGQWSPP